MTIGHDAPQLPPDPSWHSCFTILGSPFRVDQVQETFPVAPDECADPNGQRLARGDLVPHGMCAYRLPTDHSAATFRASVDAWISILEPHVAALHTLRQDGYQCFLELWTEEVPTDRWWHLELDSGCLRRLARLEIDLDIRVDAESDAHSD